YCCATLTGSASPLMIPLDGDRRLNSAMILIRSSPISASRRACREALSRAARARDLIVSRGVCVFEIARRAFFFSIISAKRLMISSHCCTGGVGSNYQILKFLHGSATVDTLCSQSCPIVQVCSDAANSQCRGGVCDNQVSRC